MHGVEIVVKLISFNIRGHFSYLGILDSSAGRAYRGRWACRAERAAARGAKSSANARALFFVFDMMRIL